MMAPPGLGPSWPPASCLPKDEGSLTLPQLGQREEIRKSWGDGVDTEPVLSQADCGCLGFSLLRRTKAF